MRGNCSNWFRGSLGMIIGEVQFFPASVLTLCVFLLEYPKQLILRLRCG